MKAGNASSSSRKICPLLRRRADSVANMKNLSALFLLLVLATGMQAAETASPSKTVESFYSAQRKKDLETISVLLHPDSFRGHRKFTEISLEKLRKAYGAEAVEAMLGKGEAELADLSDQEFFQYSVRTAWEILPVGPGPRLDRGSFRVVGEVEDGATIYTLTVSDHSYSDGERSMDLRTTESMGFRKDGDQWKICSLPFAGSVTRAFTDELIRAAKDVK